MRQLFLMIVAISLATSSATAQYTYGEPVQSNTRNKRSFGGDLRKTRLGLFIAPNNSWMKPTSSKSNDGLYLVDRDGSKVGYSWGLMVDHFFAENYGISTGVQLNTTGGIINATYDPTKLPNPLTAGIVKSAKMDYRLQYFEVPFGLKLLSDDLSGGVRIFGNIGVTAAINIGKRGTYTVTYTDTVTGNPTAIQDYTIDGENERLRGGLSILPVLFQMNLGAGMEYQITQKMSLYLGLFFNNGFAPDVTKPNELKMDYRGEFTDGNVRLNNLSLKVGMFF